MTGLDRHQLRAARVALGPVAVVAGPGSGKTATLVARIATLAERGDIDPAGALVLTHTTKAAGELADRLARAGVRGPSCVTIHAAAWRQVRSCWTRWGRDGRPELVGSAWGLVREAARAELGDVDAETVSDLVGEIDWGAATGVGPGAYARAAARAARTTAIAAERIAAVWTRYERIKRDRGVLDFADVLACATAMMDDEAIAASVRDRWTTFFVDEYQDVDRAQQRLLEAWLGDRDALTVVGDGEQCIFSFKGAEPALLRDFATRWPGAEIVHLVENYRSTAPIVEWVNALTVAPRPALVSARGAGVMPRVERCDSEDGEERALVAQLRRWHNRGVAWGAMGVLYRFHAVGARLEAALTAAAVPYHVSGTVRFFERPEVRAVLVPFGRAARLDPHSDGPALLGAAAASTGFDPDAPPAGMGAARQRWETVAALFDLVEEHYRGVSARDLLGELQARVLAQHDLDPGGVALATVHAAKGREWDCVWVAGATEGQFPSGYAKSRADLDAEQHLFYVAVSRARDELVVSAAARRHNGWRATPSRYLDLLPGAAARRAPRPASRSGGTRGGGAAVSAHLVPLSECERCGGRLTSLAARRARRCSASCLAGDEAARHQRLVAWRAARAEELAVAPEAVATDRALFAVAVLATTDGVRGIGDGGGAMPI